MWSTRHTGRARIAATVAALLILIATAACSNDTDEDASDSRLADSSGAAATAAPATAAAVDEAERDDAAAVPTGDGVAAGGGFGLDAIGRDLAIVLDVSMTSDDVRATVDGIRAAATANGGGVISADVDFGTETPPGEPATGRAKLVVKVPPEGLDAVLDGLDRLGAVTSIRQAAEDVTDQLVDLDVRIRNQRESVERIRELLTTATDLDQVVRLESELTARQVELERLEATQQQLQDRVALTTLTIHVVPAPVGLADAATDDGIGDAFRSGWDAFVTVLFGLGFVLAVLTPFLAVAAIAAGAVWLVLRGRRRLDSTTVATEDDVNEESRVGASRAG
jgi:Domain of unknown function (DUF4349)